MIIVSWKMLSKQKSSALIMTMLVVLLVASFALFVSRSSIKEAKLVDSGEASLGAYYAAEAGLEDGLARLHGDPNIEVPTCKFGTSHTVASPANYAGESVYSPCDFSDPSGVYNINLNVQDITKAAPQSFPDRIRVARFGANAARTNNSTDSDLNRAVDPTNSANSPRLHSQDYMYDLKITSKTNYFGALTTDTPPKPGNPCAANNCVATDTVTLIKNGSVKELTMATGTNPDVPKSMWIYWNCNTSGSCNASAYNLIITLVRKCATGDCINDIPLDSTYTGGGVKVPVYDDSSSDVYKIRIKPVSSEPGFVGANVSLVFYDSNYSGSSKLVYYKDSTAILQSVGYYGGVNRRLEAQVDRNSGSLLGLFDYAVYAGSQLNQ